MRDQAEDEIFRATTRLQTTLEKIYIYQAKTTWTSTEENMATR